MHIPKNAEYPSIIGQLSIGKEDWQCISISKGKQSPKPHLQSTFEEADFRIPFHVLDSVQNGHTACIIISNGTDVIISLLYHVRQFLQHNLTRLWVRAGVGDSTRHIPLHKLFHRLGNPLCAVLPAIHSLTGCDISSKVGTKKSGINCKPQRFLRRFGMSQTLSSQTVKNAELYLVKVLRTSSQA